MVDTIDMRDGYLRGLKFTRDALEKRAALLDTEHDAAVELAQAKMDEKHRMIGILSDIDREIREHSPKKKPDKPEDMFNNVTREQDQ